MGIGVYRPVRIGGRHAFRDSGWAADTTAEISNAVAVGPNERDFNVRTHRPDYSGA
ncbi:hypothetical protein GCM10022278_18300 [Allohahella marinimesophila]|uniref:Uncharacterized protein n=1 Tax=Allohahella marinimesophila TaxID=1054972 RepID=A0ABP7P6E8_9GAMM